MRSTMLRTFFIALILSLLAVSSNVVLFSRTMTSVEQSDSGTSVGFSSADPSQPLEGLKVLWLLIREPSFGASILLPQLGFCFIFLWTAAMLGSRVRSQPS